jgi:serine/threonine protein kinase
MQFVKNWMNYLLGNQPPQKDQEDRTNFSYLASPPRSYGNTYDTYDTNNENVEQDLEALAPAPLAAPVAMPPPVVLPIAPTPLQSVKPAPRVASPPPALLAQRGVMRKFKWNPLKHLKPFAEGAYGIVSKVQDEITGEFFAKKMMIFNDQNAGGTFNEIDLYSRFIHPNLMHAVDVGFEGSNVLIYLPLAIDNLNNYIHNNRNLTLQHKIYMMYELISGCLFLHTQGYYHCDIKPDNIFMFADPNGIGGVKTVLADMGLAYPFEYQQPFCGTPYWTSPQGLAKYDKHYTSVTSKIREPLDYKLADIFSLGTTFFYILTSRMLVDYRSGKPPVVEYSQTHIDSYIQAYLSRYRPNMIEYQLFSLIASMTKIEQRDRIQSLQAVLQSPVFQQAVLTKPIPGQVKATKMNNNECSLITTESYSQAMFTIKKLALSPEFFDRNTVQGLVLFIAISLFIRCTALIKSNPESTASIQLAAACFFIGAKCSDISLDTIQVADVVNVPSVEESKIRQFILQIVEFTQGVLRIPTLYDVADSAAEIRWGLDQMMNNCSILFQDPASLHFHYVNQVETAAEKMNRQSKYNFKIRA